MNTKEKKSRPMFFLRKAHTLVVILTLLVGVMMLVCAFTPNTDYFEKVRIGFAIGAIVVLGLLAAAYENLFNLGAKQIENLYINALVLYLLERVGQIIDDAQNVQGIVQSFEKEHPLFLEKMNEEKTGMYVFTNFLTLELDRVINSNDLNLRKKILSNMLFIKSHQIQIKTTNADIIQDVVNQIFLKLTDKKYHQGWMDLYEKSGRPKSLYVDLIKIFDPDFEQLDKLIPA